MKKVVLISLVVLASSVSNARESGEASLISERLIAKMEAKNEQTTKQSKGSDQLENKNFCRDHELKKARCC